MKHAIIDIGSNSIRLTVYEISGTRFCPLFRARAMTGLAGYVEVGKLSREGMDAAAAALLEFKATLESLGIGEVSVFATASLRNVINTQEAVDTLREATGFSIQVLSGGEEAALSFQGAMLDLAPESGAFADIGGASTELIAFDRGTPVHTASCRIGSLSLYKRCVGKILPGHKSVIRMAKVLEEELANLGAFPFDRRSPLICVGGTARAVLKLAGRLYDLPQGTRTVSRQQIEDMLKLFLSNEKKTCRLILRLEPDRIHTVIPGLFILQNIMALFDSGEMIVSKYGVREGFLWTKVMQSQKTTTALPRTES